MSSITFPPRPLKDINPWGINSPTQTKDWLLAIQRTAAASLGVFLFLRYGPALQARVPPFTVGAVAMIVGYCLSAPVTFIGLGAHTYYNFGVNLMNLKGKNMTFIVIDILTIAGAYVIVDTYQMKIPYLPSPNFLDKVFNSIADRYCGTVYDRFFSR